MSYNYARVPFSQPYPKIVGLDPKLNFPAENLVKGHPLHLLNESFKMTEFRSLELAFWKASSHSTKGSS